MDPPQLRMGAVKHFSANSPNGMAKIQQLNTDLELGIQK